MLCKNLLTEKSSLDQIDRTRRLTDDTVSEATLQLASNADIRGAISRLEAHKVTDSAEDFKLRQQAIGFTYEPEGLLSDPDLIDIVFPVDNYCHDWMHGLFATGVFNIIVFLLFSHAQTFAPNIWEQLSDFVSKFRWPESANFVTTRGDHFSPKRVASYRKARVFKCSASDALSLLPVLYIYVLRVVSRISGMCIMAC